jgi:hypothetical protein
MRKFAFLLAASAGLVAFLGEAVPAHAAFATFVSGNGSDAADCLTPDTACREIFGAAGALSKTDEGGVIHVLPGEYIAFPVDKSVDIVADGGQASIYSTVAGGDGGIVVGVSGDSVVRIHGFLISSSNGIVINGGGTVHIENSTLTGAETKYGIVYAPTGASELYVSDTTVSRPGVPSNAGGILIKPTGSGSAKVVLDNLEATDNAKGIVIDGSATTGSNTVTVRNSTIAGSTIFGLQAVDSGAGTTSMVIEGSTVTNNGTQGVRVSGANASIRMRDSTVTNNGARGLFTENGGQVISHGGNVIAGNPVNGGFNSTVAPQ